MGRTFIQQDTQIYSSDTYDDTLAAGSTLQSGAANLQDDLNSIRSQLKRAIFDDGAGNWYADIPTVNSKKRAISDLNTDLNDIEEKRFLFRSQVLTDITVGTGENWVTLVQASSETPTEAAAVGAGTFNGAIVATLAADVGSHSLNEVSGPNAISPKNLVLIRDAATGQILQSGTKDIYGLLQVETGVVDGDAFNDTNHQAQISFVIENGAGSDLIACPVADIEDKVINYSYVRRINLDSVPETAFLSGVFIDQSASATDTTLNNAIDNQVGPATQTDRNIRWQITDTFSLDFEDSTGARDILKIAPGAGGDAVTFDVDTFTVTNSTTSTFTNGVSVDTGGTQINLGVTAGQIDSAGALTVASAAAADLRLLASGEMFLDDVNQTGSTWSQTNGIKLSDTTAEWDDFETVFGEVSILRAIYMARSGTRTKGVAVPTGDIAANTNVTGAASPNLDAQLPAYLSGDFLTKVDVYLNGMLLRNGANAAANNDVYPGDTPADGDLKFEFGLKGGANPDVITVVVFD